LQKNILKDTSSFLASTLLILIVFTLNSCEDKKHEAPIIPIENTTEIFTSKDKDIQSSKQKEKKVEKVEEVNISILSTKKEVTSQDESVSNDFRLKDKQHTYQVSLLNQRLTFLDIQKSIVIINFFKSDCTACLSQINAFKKLEKKYNKELFILNLFDNAQDKEIINFTRAVQHSLDVTTDISPLSVIYKNGDYYNHFEGLAPIEMINHDIQQAIKK
jgi:thiol-disulfide isomerase/thioredoxin